MNTTDQQTLPMLTDAEESMGATETAGVGAVTSSRGNLPLRQLSIRAQVNQLTCQTTVRQMFHNCHDEFLEATYIFPLPGRHAVTSCVMCVGQRRVVADLQERSEARAAYNQAIQEGRRAAIAEEDRSEVFTLRVGNIPPGEEVSVELILAGPVPVVAGEATLRFPLVVAPRYVPGKMLDGPPAGSGVAFDTDQAPDASCISPPTLLPGVPNPIDLQVEVSLSLGGLAPAADWRTHVRSSLHSAIIGAGDPCVVRLLPGERVNRDFILRYPVLQSAPRAAAVWGVDEDGNGTVAVAVTPPARDPMAPATPRDVCVVLDRSGSMSGWKMVAARRAAGRLIDSLDDADRFRLIAFDNVIEEFSPNQWSFASDQRRWQAAEWLGKIDARGGTELGGAMKSAFKAFRSDPSESPRQPIVVVVTDGQVANEDSILRTLAANAFPIPPRVFTVGIDRAVNAGLLQRLADQGHGAFELVESEERLDQVMDRFHRELGAPVLTDLQVEPIGFRWEGEPAPSRTTDVFLDRPSAIYGRFAATEPSVRFRITAKQSNGEAWFDEVEAVGVDAPALRAMWGRARVRDLEDQYAAAPVTQAKPIQRQIIAASLESGVLSRFTAFVAVDQAEVVNEGGEQHRVTQAVDQPEGWESPAPTGRLSKLRKMVTSRFTRGGDASRRQRKLAPSQSPPTSPPSISAMGTEDQDLASSSILGHEALPESVARENRIVADVGDDGVMRIRMEDPNDQATVEKLQFILNQPIEITPATPEEIEQEITHRYGDSDETSADSMLQEFTDTAIDFTETEDDLLDIDFCESDDDETPRRRDVAPDGRVIVKLTQLMITEGVQLKASHILIKPEQGCFRILYVIDGAVCERDTPPRALFDAVFSRLRTLSHLDTSATEGLQRGVFELTVGPRTSPVRAYFLSSDEGTMVLLRLTHIQFAKATLPTELDALLDAVKKSILVNTASPEQREAAEAMQADLGKLP